jgi:hypothetical protein
MLIPTQTQRLRPATVKPQQVLLKNPIRFQADSSNTTDGPYSLSQTELDKLSLKEKRHLFAKLPLLKYQGKPLTGSEFLNLVYNFAYPEKNAWQHFVQDASYFIDGFALSVVTLGWFPVIFYPTEKTATLIAGTKPLLPQKGLNRELFKDFCKTNFKGFTDKGINATQLINLLIDLKLVYSYQGVIFQGFETDPPLSFTRVGKKLIHSPFKGFPTQSLLNNRTFANRLEPG